MKRRGFFGAFAGLIAAPAAAAMVTVTKQVEGALPVADKPKVAEMYASGYDDMTCSSMGTLYDFNHPDGRWDEDAEMHDPDMEDER